MGERAGKETEPPDNPNNDSYHSLRACQPSRNYLINATS